MSSDPTLTASSFSVGTYNVRGFSDSKKQVQIMQYLKKFKCEFYCLADTRFDNFKENQFRNDFGSQYRIFCANYSSNARGTMILVSKETPFDLIDYIATPDGNRITIIFKYYGKQVSLSALYGPNTDEPDFFESLFRDVYDLNIEHNIITGDWNTAPEAKDYANYVTFPHPGARAVINESMRDYNCFDTYRHFNKNTRAYTYRSDGGPQKSRLDYCIASNSLLQYTKKSIIKHKFRSDHDFTLNCFDFHGVKMGRGFWRLDNLLLKDEVFITKIEDSIKLCLAKYVRNANYENFLEQAPADAIDNFLNQPAHSFHNFEYTINPNLLVEMLLNDIKNSAISYSVAKKKNENSRLNELLLRIDQLYALRHTRHLTNDEQTELDDLTNEHEGILEIKAEVIMKRDKLLNKLEGEKASKYFCSLEKERSTERFIPQLDVDRNGQKVRITDQKEIVKGNLTLALVKLNIH